MRIGFDITPLGQQKAGMGYLTFSLLQALQKLDGKNRYSLYESFGEDYWDPKSSNPFQGRIRQRFRSGLRHFLARDVQRFWANPPKNLEKILGYPDVVQSNNFYAPHTLIRARLLFTLYDVSFFEYPEWHTPANWVVCSRGVFRASLYADAMLAISEYSKRQYLEYYPYFPSDRIFVVPLASRFPLKPLNSVAPAERLLRSNEFFLSVGTLEPRKNHVRMLDAYARAFSNHPDLFPLVLVGANGWKSDHLTEMAASLGIAAKVILLDYVKDEHLQWLYQNCYAFLYPSLFEGFGMPPLEAMSMGAAVITSNTTSLPEVVGDAALRVNPYQTEEIAEAILALYTNPDLRKDLQARSLKRAALFSWEKSAEQVLDIYEQVYRLPKRHLGA